MENLNLDDTFGAAFIGAAIMMGLYGVTSLQTYFYFTRYEKDQFSIKALVFIVWALDTCHSALVCHAIYYYLVTNYGRPQTLAIGTVSLYTSILINLTVSSIVQAFFVKRIFILTPAKFRWWIASLVSLLVLCHVVFGLITIVALYIKKRFDRLPELTAYGATPFAIFAVLADIAIAASLCILLNKKRTGFSRTNTLVTTLIIYAINRCLLTSLTAVLEIVVFAAMPKSFWFLAIDFVIGKLYANSFLATLNTRHVLRGSGVIDTASNGVSLSSFRWGGSMPTSAPSHDSARGQAVKFDTAGVSVSVIRESTADGGRREPVDDLERASSPIKSSLIV